MMNRVNGAAELVELQPPGGKAYNELMFEVTGGLRSTSLRGLSHYTPLPVLRKLDVWR